LTSEGLRLERDLASDESAVRPSHRKLDLAIMVVLSVTVLLLADRFVPLRDPASTASSPGKSIAVLPFEKLSDDKGNTEGVLDFV
jgi:hypothetical protein